MKYIYNLFLSGAIVFLGGCADDFPQSSRNDLTNLPTVEAFLSLSVDDFGVSSATRAAEPSGETENVSEGEKRIDDIWVFQYNKEGQLLNSGTYYNISSQSDLGDIVNGNLKVNLVEGESTICVVTNVTDQNWGTQAIFNTYEGLRTAVLPNPKPILIEEVNSVDPETKRSIPMEGEESAIVGQGAKIQINVTRMFAKLKISFGDLELSGNDKIDPRSIEIYNIPNYCRVKSLGEEINHESTPATYGTNIEWIGHSFNAQLKEGETPDPTKEYILYVPENLQGEVENPDGKYKGEVAPTKALGIELTMNNSYYVAAMGDALFEEEVQYNLFPGGNNTNNFNIRRNNVYRIKTNIKTVDVHNPSSNCFVVVPGENLAFEPYYRTEIGGKYGDDADVFDILTYMNPTDEDKQIEYAEIIWQDKDVIGDNSAGNLVKYIPNETEPYHSKIYVKTNPAKVEGNALVGAFNKKGEILWSWHIWITANDPANVGNAVVYTTYDWDSNGIKDYRYDRIPGYAVMSCNLGALADVPNLTEDELKEPENEPSDGRSAKLSKTFGMLYQWGRKDPFPPMVKIYRTDHDYTEQSTGIHYDNSNKKKIDKTGWDSSKLTKFNTSNYSGKVAFYSVMNTDAKVQGSNGDNTIKFSIANPCTFICGTLQMFVGEGDGKDPADKYCQDIKSYDPIVNGDWNIKSNPKLWGGLDPTTPGIKTYTYTIGESTDKNYISHIFNNYGDEKSIFDPCPSGWRVPPGELWLGFSKTGLNPANNDEVNHDEDATGTGTQGGGMYMYMTKSKWDKNGNLIPKNTRGRTLFFPTQGSREASGNCLRVSFCGNYHTATTDLNNKVNVLHIHNGTSSTTPFKIFESFHSYTVKSQAAPIRCVRDRK